MNKWLAVLAATVAVAGCSNLGVGRAPMNAQFPQVSVVRDRYIVIDQEPIIAQRGSTITWQLPEGKATFERSQGITIDALVKAPPRPGTKPQAMPSDTAAQQRSASARSLFPCSARSEREFSCAVPPDAKPGQYAYTVRLKTPAGDLILDPTVIVEE